MESVIGPISRILSIAPHQIIPLAGDASSRSYFRVHGLADRRVIMKMEPFDETCDFLKIRQFLEQNNVPVPKVHDCYPANGLIILQDLGDETIESVIHKNPQMATSTYQHLLHLIGQFAALPVNEISLVSARSFDYEKLFWEMNFTKMHMEKMAEGLGSKMSVSKNELLNKIMLGFSELISEIVKVPKVFSHRDFHCRNVMSLNDNYFVIDFQDARLGLIEYDLVSLLLDPYQALKEKDVRDHIDYFIKIGAKYPLINEGGSLRQNFAMIGLQRLFKCIGSYLSFYNLKNNSNYLKYIPQAIEKMTYIRGQHSGVDKIINLINEMQIEQMFASKMVFNNK